MAEVRLSVRCDPADKERWFEHAKARGKDFSTWAREILNQEIELATQGKPGIVEMALRYETVQDMAREEREIPSKLILAVMGPPPIKG